jgi:glutamate synthase (NADPH) small chain
MNTVAPSPKWPTARNWRQPDMGKPTGFLEYARIVPAYAPVDERLGHYREFVAPLSNEQVAIQGARCMDCGIPFCNNGCPVNNLIPDWNDLVYRQHWAQAIEALHSTNNFPEFTGRICPAPCEAACTLNVNADAVGIKSIEQAIIDKAWQEGWVVPKPAAQKTGKTVAIVGSGPAGLACAQQLARAGHAVTVFEKNDAIGGLLRYGIPDFKMEKTLIDRRVAQMEAESVQFRTGVRVGEAGLPDGIIDDATEQILPASLLHDFDAVVLAAGAEVPRDLPAPGRALEGVHFALEFLIPQNKAVAGGSANPISAKGKHVIVIGGGDTGSDCVGTSYRHGAASVTQFELMPKPPEQEDKALTWPYWPHKLRTSSSHLEGETRREYGIATKAFMGENGRLTGVQTVRLAWENGKMSEIPGSEQTFKADLVFLAMGFTQPVTSLLDGFGLEKDGRGNAKADTEGSTAYTTNVPKVFAAGDVRRGQSLVVWAIREGRQCARAVDTFLMGESVLPR